MSKYGVAIIGCGNIAGPYADDLRTYEEIALLGVTDVDAARAKAFAEKYSIKAYENLDALLADPQVQIVVNLTSHFAHHEVNTKALNAGKHVFSEKPMAVETAEALAQVELAKAKGLRLACAPFTLMGEAQQTAWKYIRDGKLGPVRVAYAEVNWGRIEAWHPAPGPFYEVGALFDVGVYPLTILTSMFGPVKRVSSYGTLLYPNRITKEGVPFSIRTPDWVVTVLETESEAVIRLTTDFYVSNQTSRQTGIEFHGDAGSLFLESWHDFDCKVHYAEFGKSFQEIPHIRTASRGVPRGRGTYELVRAIIENRPHRFSGEHAWHVVDILNSAVTSMEENRPVDVTSRFDVPTPMEWAD
ncbi:MAG TPA: Gfo/Idh/MocA family oxidoreductase [Aggregatilineales bacterium]|nr:Gfo/Idh/MocA family oxidoreductase [Anaerolineae bacterium]HUN08423.1 Gfo/Idh/MocA family oxidoreductase [Aggregatilineales bacterium]